MEKKIEVTPDNAGPLYMRGQIGVKVFLENEALRPNLGDALMRLSEKHAAFDSQNGAVIPQILVAGEPVPVKPGKLSRVATSIKNRFLPYPRN